jgi:DNA mismatch endonuclease (patch repair protein)
MADVHDIATRSYNMSRIKGFDTKPEILVRKFLHSQGFRFRLYNKQLPGKPDLRLPKYQTVIFVNGCFWHGHKGCKYFVMPKTRTKWWKEKIDKTVKRDYNAMNVLKQLGWKSLVIWECELNPTKREQNLNNLREKIYI